MVIRRTAATLARLAPFAADAGADGGADGIAYVADPPPEGQELKNWSTRQFEALQRRTAALQASLDALGARLDALEGEGDTWD